MAKIYSKKASVAKNLKPKKEVVSFLLNYSKALTVVKVKNVAFELVSN